MSVRKIEYRPISPFGMAVKYAEVDSKSPENEFDAHVHPECEIYINVSGNVSFIVENHIYPIVSGSIIITRPYEYHHCVYHSDELHKHFWILFSADRNEELFDMFYKRKAGENNLLILSPKKTKELYDLCHEMIRQEETGAEEYYRFFQLISLLKSAKFSDQPDHAQSQDVIAALNYINQNFVKPLSIQQLADQVFVSVNTLERHFSECLGLTPSAYLKKKRLANAAELLYKGFSVTEACERSGFSDYSNFIALFRKHYGITPLKYKKECADRLQT